MQRMNSRGGINNAHSFGWANLVKLDGTNGCDSMMNLGNGYHSEEVAMTLLISLESADAVGPLVMLCLLRNRARNTDLKTTHSGYCHAGRQTPLGIDA